MSWKNFFLAAVITAFLVGVAGCKQESPSSETTTPEITATSAVPGAGNEHAHPTFPLTGKVVEIHNGAGYSYILLDTGSSQHWVATTQIEVAVGDELGFEDGNIMHDFPSKALDRTFPEIIFASQVMGQSGGGHGSDPSVGQSEESASGSFASALKKEKKQDNAHQASSMTAVPTQGSSKAAMPSADIKVEKAVGANAYSVEELFAKAAELNGKTVLLRAQVMKFSPQIMGKNWLHVQDGTGNPAKATHDLVVTTKATAQKGDTILLEATMKTDQDFGYGYVYNVILEDAVIK